MAKIPKGTIVKVDLWNSSKDEGLIKYVTDTLELVRARSKYSLDKGDLAIVTESNQSFLNVIPKNRFTDVVEKWHSSRRVNKKNLINLVYVLLKERVNSNGGILLLNDLWEIIAETPLKEVLTRQQMTKYIDSKNAHFDILDKNDVVYISLKPEECDFDEISFLKYTADFPYITRNMIKMDLKWSNIRINRMVDYLKRKGLCREVEKLPEGKLLFIQK